MSSRRYVAEVDAGITDGELMGRSLLTETINGRSK
jgi:hypothetical protein